ncbi:hypothetical protein WN48_08247 [Eufriesea mexicana]|nr:hypothetical protein WN48_08247 [Eufriesea mexicana]
MIVSLSHAEANLDGVATSMDKNTWSMQRGPVNVFEVCRSVMYEHRGCSLMLFNPFTMVTLAERR